MKRSIVLLFALFLFAAGRADEAPAEPILHEKPSQVPEKVGVQPATADEAIAHRLLDILNATGWFVKARVSVEKGVVFLYGETKNHQFKDWAGDLARNTQDVTAVVNKIVVEEPSVWDVHMVLHELKTQVRKMGRALPAILFGGIILFISWLLARLVYRLVPRLFRNKVNPSLLHEVFARAISTFVFILGVYFIFEMANLTTMALTILSGTGLIGIIVGIAFRDITENFLASILLSIQNPFHAGDLIDVISPVTGYSATGYVERLTLRVTILVLLDGNHLQIPNSTVYKSNIRNYSTNPNRRDDFLVPIRINCSVSKAVETALNVLKENEAVLKDPEPLVLVEGLDKEVVNLHVYYWINVKKNNWMKVKSAVIRLIKHALQSEEVNCFLAKETPCKEGEKHEELTRTQSETKTASDQQTKGKIQGLSDQSRTPEGGKNFLNPKKGDGEQK